MDKVPEIKKGIPVPGKGSHRPHGKWVFLLREMKVGDCIDVTERQAIAIRVAAKRINFAITARRIDGPDLVRVWRIRNGQ